MFDLVREMNAAMDRRRGRRSPTPRSIREAFDEFDRVLGVLALRRAEDARPPVPVDEIERLIAERRDARQRRATSRAPTRSAQDLDARGIVLEDSAAGHALETEVAMQPCPTP